MHRNARDSFADPGVTGTLPSLRGQIGRGPSSGPDYYRSLSRHTDSIVVALRPAWEHDRKKNGAAGGAGSLDWGVAYLARSRPPALQWATHASPLQWRRPMAGEFDFIRWIRQQQAKS